MKDGTGETPQAFVVLKPRPLDGSYASHGELEDHATTEEELKGYLGSRLAKYKALNGVTFLTDIPRTPSGKVQKFKLRELYMRVSETKKRKSNVLETNDDGEAASSNRMMVPAASNGTPKPASNGQVDFSGVLEQKDVNGRAVHESKSSRKRVKIGLDVECNGTWGEADSASVLGGTVTQSKGRETHANGVH